MENNMVEPAYTAMCYWCSEGKSRDPDGWHYAVHPYPPHDTTVLGYCDDLAVERMRKALSAGERATLEEVAERVEWVVEGYSRICTRLQECCQQHHLGLGGEAVDAVVVEEIDRLRAELDKLSTLPDAAKIEIRRARTKEQSPESEAA
jgi:hypothetical protein